MIDHRVEKIMVGHKDRLEDAVRLMDRERLGICLVVDEARHLVGTITDGDVRHAMLKGHGMLTPLDALLAGKGDPISVSLGTPATEIRELMLSRGVRHIPVLDADRTVVGLATIEDLLPPVQAVEAVVMAGGRGVRLAPLTETTPKPMLPVAGRPMLEHIIEHLKNSGVSDINVSTHYLQESIHKHFGDGNCYGVNINYITDDQPLGTAGPLGRLNYTGTGPVLVINGDIITRTDIAAFCAFHREHKADFTVGVRQHEVKVPFGVLECDDFRIKKIVEKPTYNMLISAGIYLVEPEVLKMVAPGRHMDMPDLIDLAINNGRNVAAFPIREYWVDVGRHLDYQRVNADLVAGSIAE